MAKYGWKAIDWKLREKGQTGGSELSNRKEVVIKNGT
jgi:hypothetical protein